MEEKDFPPHSRLFVGGTDCVDEDLFREVFQDYGIVLNVHFVKHKETGKPKGIAYVQFDKASEAAFAMEALSNKKILNSFKPLVVKIAQDKGEPQYDKDTNEDDRILRVFIRVPAHEDEDSLRQHFLKFGEIKKIVMLKNKGRQSFAFVKYHKASDTALAVENCDSRYGAIFGKLQVDTSDHHGHGFKNHFKQPRYNMDENSDLIIQTMVPVNPLAMQQLLDLVPGLIFCKPQTISNNTVFYIRYANNKSASYARDKLYNFEYPPTMPIHINFATSTNFDVGDTNFMSDMAGNSFTTSTDPQTMWNAFMNVFGRNKDNNSFMNSLFSMNSYDGSGVNDMMSIFGGGEDTPYGSSSGEKVPFCSISLPYRQPLAPPDARTVERLWVMGYPKIPAMDLLNNVFCRFGNLITIIPSKDRNYCYVHYADKDSAQQAMDTIDKCVISQMEMKVVLANPRHKSQSYGSDDYSKRSTSNGKNYHTFKRSRVN